MTFLDPYLYVLLFGAGVAAGVINTVAGGGSVITLPVMIFAGLPAGVANATNRIGLLAQNLVAIKSFQRYGVMERHLSWRLMIVAAIGAVAGARLAVILPDHDFEKILGVIMLALLVLILKNPKPKLVSENEAPENEWLALSPRGKVGLMAGFLALGVYAGFIQAGMGVMVLLVLSYFLRMDFVRGNYIKLVVILGLTVIALATFLLSGVAVDIWAAVATGGGQSIGALMGSWVAVRKGERWIKIIMTVAILLSSAKLLGVF